MKLYELCGEDTRVRFSPFVWRIKMALAHKGLQYDAVPICFTDKAPIAPSGSKTVPVLEDKGTWVSDSWKIANYLEDTYPDKPSLFDGNSGRASAHLFSQWTDLPIVRPLFMAIVADIPAHLSSKDKAYFFESREKRIGMSLDATLQNREENLQAFHKALDPVRRHLKAYPYIAGESPLYHDYLLFGFFQWARLASPVKLLDADDILYDWRERLLDMYGGMARKAYSPFSES